MKLLFLSIGDIPSIKHHEIYPDLLREFVKNGHEVYVVCAREKRKNAPTELIDEDGAKLLKVRIGNITKTNIFEKGISTVLVGKQYKAAIKKYFSNIKFDLVMYSTPPITLANVVEYVKKRDESKTYLLLKDIFPQNAVDIGLMSENGIKGIIYKYFRAKEKKLYALSDIIGCMSQANVDYLLKHNPTIGADKVEVCPNCIDIQNIDISDEEKNLLRNKYGIPLDKKVFVYGGNLGAPQDIPFVIECLKVCKDIDAYFLIIGDGTEFDTLQAFIKIDAPQNVMLIKRLPKEDYDRTISACDIGLIFLDHRFTIPNFPSRLLAYMQAGLPVIACTDTNTDIGTVITDVGFGSWCESNKSENFASTVLKFSQEDQNIIKEKGLIGRNFLSEQYSSMIAYKIVMKSYETLNEYKGVI